MSGSKASIEVAPSQKLKAGAEKALVTDKLCLTPSPNLDGFIKGSEIL